MDYSSDDSIGFDNDEITEVKRVLREAKARKRTLNMKLSTQSEKMALDRCEMQAAYKKQFNEIQRLTAQVNELDLELRNARFEIGHSCLKETKKNEEIAILQSEHRSVMNEMQKKLEEKDRIHSEQLAFILKESDKLSSLVSSVHSSVCDSSKYLEYKSCKQLLSTATKEAASLRAYVASVSNGKAESKSHRTPHEVAVVPSPPSSSSSGSSLDSTLMDMCRSLEEENSTLTTSLDQMRRRLAAAEEEIAKNNLIPHYRLAIVRARTYTANLLEQLKREQFTSESLRDQLEATYADLKRMAEEKRSLYHKLSKYQLETDRHDHYSPPEDFLSERAVPRNNSSSSSSGGGGGGGVRSRKYEYLDADLPSARRQSSSQQQQHASQMDSISALDREIEDLHIKLSTADSAGGGRSGSGAVSERTS